MAGLFIIFVLLKIGRNDAIPVGMAPRLYVLVPGDSGKPQTKP
jgi:hypothetical protein